MRVLAAQMRGVGNRMGRHSTARLAAPFATAPQQQKPTHTFKPYIQQRRLPLQAAVSRAPLSHGLWRHLLRLPVPYGLAGGLRQRQRQRARLARPWRRHSGHRHAAGGLSCRVEPADRRGPAAGSPARTVGQQGDPPPPVPPAACPTAYRAHFGAAATCFAFVGRRPVLCIPMWMQVCMLLHLAADQPIICAPRAPALPQVPLFSGLPAAAKKRQPVVVQFRVPISFDREDVKVDPDEVGAADAHTCLSGRALGRECLCTRACAGCCVPHRRPPLHIPSNLSIMSHPPGAGVQAAEGGAAWHEPQPAAARPQKRGGRAAPRGWRPGWRRRHPGRRRCRCTRPAAVQLFIQLPGTCPLPWQPLNAWVQEEGSGSARHHALPAPRPHLPHLAGKAKGRKYDSDDDADFVPGTQDRTGMVNLTPGGRWRGW